MIQWSCEHYAWVMAGCIEPTDPFYDKFPEICRAIGKAGFRGFEPIDKFLYSHYEPAKLGEALKEGGVELSSVVLLDDWLSPKETEAEQEAADRLIDFLHDHFPKAVMMLCQMPTAREESDLVARQDNLISCINTISKRAADKGVACSYHPNSPETSIWRTQADYDRLLPMLDAAVLGWTPDVGHMAATGMDPVQMMRDYRSLINHVHYKDMNEDRSWALMGEGIIDFETITRDLMKTDFTGWIVVEDECERSVNEPNQVTQECGDYCRDTLMPLIEEVVA